MKLSDLRERVFEGFGGSGAGSGIEDLVCCHCCGGHGFRKGDLWDCAGRWPCVADEVIMSGISFSVKPLIIDHENCLEGLGYCS